MIGADGGRGAAMAALLRPHRGAIAGAYAALLDFRGDYSQSLNVRQAWSDLAEDSRERAAGVRLLLDVRETDDAEPYPDAAAMCADIAAGRFVVSRANSDHPLWTPADNVAFRIVHDVLGHFAASVRLGYPASYVRAVAGIVPPSDTVAGFDWRGETAACGAHVPLLPTLGARRALFTECLAQTAYAIDRGEFAAQRVGFVGHFLCGDDAAQGAYQRFTNGKVG